MIFVTVGTQLPFERLVRAMDEWAYCHPDEEVFMQTGETAYRPMHADFTAFAGHEQWEELFQRADRVVSHAGMGTILKSLDRGKPLIIMPRLAAAGEHRNDHQLATADRFRGFASISVADDAESLIQALDKPVVGVAADLKANSNLTLLISEIRKFVAKTR